MAAVCIHQPRIMGGNGGSNDMDKKKCTIIYTLYYYTHTHTHTGPDYMNDCFHHINNNKSTANVCVEPESNLRVPKPWGFPVRLVGGLVLSGAHTGSWTVIKQPKKTGSQAKSTEC